MNPLHSTRPAERRAAEAMRLRCALNLDAHTLSAWRDRLLTPAEDAQVSAHLAEDDCAACQAQLATYDAIAVTLRAQRAPTPAPLDMAALRPPLLRAQPPAARPRLRLLPFRRASGAAPRHAAHAHPGGAFGESHGSPQPRADPRLAAGWSGAQEAGPTGKRGAPTEATRRLTTRGSTMAHPRDGLWRGLGAAVACLLLVTALAQLLLHTEVGRTLLGATTKGHPTHIVQAASPTPIHRPVARLAWAAATLPPGFHPNLYSTNTIVVAPSDGLTAYACYPTGNPWQSAPQVWVTHDAHTWSRAISFPSQAFGWCAITVDAADADRMVVGLAWPGPPDTQTNGPDSYYATEDGGQTWRALAGLGNTDLLKLATLDGAQFAFVQTENAASVYSGNRLLVSRDDMQTWAPTDAAMIGADASGPQQLYELWVNPYTNEVAELTLLYGSPKQPTLWESRDVGQTWRVVSHATDTNYIAQTPAPGQAWRYCAYNYTASNTLHPDELLCARFDGGAASVSPGLSASFADGDGVGILPDSLFALTASGDTLASSNVHQSDGSRLEHIYRFTAATGRWQDIGSPPTAQAQLFYAPTANGGEIIWTVPDLYGGSATLYTATYS